MIATTAMAITTTKIQAYDGISPTSGSCMPASSSAGGWGFSSITSQSEGQTSPASQIPSPHTADGGVTGFSTAMPKTEKPGVSDL